MMFWMSQNRCILLGRLLCCRICKAKFCLMGVETEGMQHRQLHMGQGLTVRLNGTARGHVAGGLLL